MAPLGHQAVPPSLAGLEDFRRDRHRLASPRLPRRRSERPLPSHDPQWSALVNMDFRRSLCVTAALFASACGTPSVEERGSTPPAQATTGPPVQKAPTPSIPVVFEPLAPGEPISAPLDLSRHDQCSSMQYGWLLGRPRSEIPTPPRGTVWRIACSTCALTEDFSPQRLTILFDQATGSVTDLRCG